jgi:UPF0755 protein
VSVIHPGTYVLLTQMRAADAVAALVLIANQPVVVRIPEGYTVTRALDRIAAVTGISSSDLAAAVADPASIGIPPDAIGPGAADGDRAGANRRIEGWLFPTTYLVRSSDTAVTVLSAMVARTIQELTDQSVAPADWHNTLVKASIVMREALPADYAKVARVIDNRLAGCGGDGTLGMDAIDSYGLGIPADMITRAQFAAPDLPYASRVHQGLPPTPIANPGSAAIAATINPTEGDWCWFVTVNLDTGETKFTGSYQEFLQFSAELTDWLAAKAAQTTPAATQ